MVAVNSMIMSLSRQNHKKLQASVPLDYIMEPPQIITTPRVTLPSWKNPCNCRRQRPRISLPNETSPHRPHRSQTTSVESKCSLQALTATRLSLCLHRSQSTDVTSLSQRNQTQTLGNHFPLTFAMERSRSQLHRVTLSSQHNPNVSIGISALDFRYPNHNPQELQFSPNILQDQNLEPPLGLKAEPPHGSPTISFNSKWEHYFPHSILKTFYTIPIQYLSKHTLYMSPRF